MRLPPLYHAPPLQGSFLLPFLGEFPLPPSGLCACPEMAGQKRTSKAIYENHQESLSIQQDHRTNHCPQKALVTLHNTVRVPGGSSLAMTLSGTRT